MAVLKEHLGKTNIFLNRFVSRICSLAVFYFLLNAALRSSVARQATAARDDLKSQIRALDQVLTQERSDMKDITAGLFCITMLSNVLSTPTLFTKCWKSWNKTSKLDSQML